MSGFSKSLVRLSGLEVQNISIIQIDPEGPVPIRSTGPTKGLHQRHQLAWSIVMEPELHVL